MECKLPLQVLVDLLLCKLCRQIPDVGDVPMVLVQDMLVGVSRQGRGRVRGITLHFYRLFTRKTKWICIQFYVYQIFVRR